MERVSCRLCGAKILPRTADKYDGICSRCHTKQKREQFLKKHEAKPGCPSCDGMGYKSFNWEMAQERTGDEIDKYPKYLEKEQFLKFGDLYRCPICDEKWFLDPKEQFMIVVPKDRLALLWDWHSRQLYLNKELLSKAKSIGTNPSRIYEANSEHVAIPCKVTTRKSEDIDFSMIVFQTGHPIDTQAKNIRFVDEIADIEQSKYALPSAVRIACSRAEEVSMTFAPTYVQTSDGQPFVLNWMPSFFWYNGIEGEGRG